MSATKRAGEIRIGTSGWIYRHWRGRFYPEKLPTSKWFEYYAQHFDTVEINNTFYRLTSPEAFDAWRKQAPDGFIYAVKCNRYLTHNLKLTHAAEPLERFFTRTRRLKEHLGPVLYQLPPRWKKNVDRLEEFLPQLPKRIVHVMEFREPSWISADVFEVLRKHGVALCIHDNLPHHPREVTARTVYIRFHGSEGKYVGSYSRPQLRGWAKWMLERAAEGHNVFAYFNNDINAHAIANAKTLLELVRH